MIYTFIPPLLPIRFVEYGTPITSEHHHRPLFDKALFSNWITEEQRDVTYTQKIQQSQLITVQIHTDATSYSLKIVDCSNTVIQSISPLTFQIAGNLYNGTQLTTCQWSFRPDQYTIADGEYHLRIDLATFTEKQTHISEPLSLAETYPTLAIWEI